MFVRVGVWFGLFFGAVVAIAMMALVQPVAADGMRVETVVIETASGRHSFKTEIADNEPQRNRGLMFRRHMPGDHAMLFLWDRPIEAAMWMKNTLISLDMLFVTGDGRVIHVARNTTPHSLAAITAGKPVRAVVELAAGTAARLRIEPGSRVHHRAFGG